MLMVPKKRYSIRQGNKVQLHSREILFYQRELLYLALLSDLRNIVLYSSPPPIRYLFPFSIFNIFSLFPLHLKFLEK